MLGVSFKEKERLVDELTKSLAESDSSYDPVDCREIALGVYESLENELEDANLEGLKPSTDIISDLGFDSLGLSEVVMNIESSLSINMENIDDQLREGAASTVLDLMKITYCVKYGLSYKVEEDVEKKLHACEFIKDCPTLKSLNMVMKESDRAYSADSYAASRDTLNFLRERVCDSSKEKGCPTYHILKEKK